MRVGLQAAIVNKLLWSWKMSIGYFTAYLFTSQFPASNRGQYLLCAHVCQSYHCVQSYSNRKWPWSSVLHRAMMSLCFLLVLAWLCRWVCSWFQRADHHKANLRSLFPVCHCELTVMFRWFRNGISGCSQKKKNKKHFGLMFEETTEAQSQWWVREKCFCFVKETAFIKPQYYRKWNNAALWCSGSDGRNIFSRISS